MTTTVSILIAFGVYLFGNDRNWNLEHETDEGGQTISFLEDEDFPLR